MGDLTKNLSRSEFQCNCGHCPPPVVDFVTVNVIQDSANHFARKLGVNKVVVNIHSGHRCAWWNGKEGGVRGSNHVDFEAVDFPENIQALLNYAIKLTLYPQSVDEDDVQTLREVDFSDEDILNINLIVSYFNFVNRIASGLGVDENPDEQVGYNY